MYFLQLAWRWLPWSCNILPN